MGLFSKIWNVLKIGVSKLIGLFKNKSPGQVIEDASKAAVGIATVAAVSYAAVNVVKSLLMRGKNRRSEKRRPRSGVDFFHESRETGSIDEKLDNAKKSYQNVYGRYSALTQDEMDILEEVSKTRNQMFRLLNPADQLNLLRIEGFDFDEFKEKLERERDTRKIRKSKRRVGEASPEDQSFREPVDYGWFNWIMRPLDDFLCWLKDDPTPKKCTQVHVVDREIIPNINVNSPEEAVASIRKLGPYLDSRENGDRVAFASMADAKEMAICAEEVFKHKNVKSFRKAVRTRMLQDSNGLSSQIFDLMEDDIKSDKKKKRKHDYDDDDDSAYFKKKKDKKREDKAHESEADEEAARIYNHFLKNALAGKEESKTFRLDHLFDGV